LGCVEVRFVRVKGCIQRMPQTDVNGEFLVILPKEEKAVPQEFVEAWMMVVANLDNALVLDFDEACDIAGCLADRPG